MNNNLRHFLLRSNFLLSFLYFTKRCVYEKKFFREIERRKSLCLFDVDELSKPLSICPIDYCPDNNMYGLSAILKEYCGLPLSKPIKACIEHGLYFGDYVSKDEKYYPKSLKIVTFSNYREEKIKKTSCKRDIFLIGPYIKYAHSLLSEDEISKIKQQYGRILLVFPLHSIVGADNNFNFKELINEIFRQKARFDSIWICVYYLDLLKIDIIDEYRRNGFKIVTCGHKYDLNFMNRQRTLIELSAGTMSNDVGTHVGYSIALNKPHYIYRQEVETCYANEVIKKKHADNIIQETSSVYKNEREEVYKAFSSDDFVITSAQQNLIEKYWGSLTPLSPNILQSLK